MFYDFIEFMIFPARPSFCRPKKLLRCLGLNLIIRFYNTINTFFFLNGSSVIKSEKRRKALRSTRALSTNKLWVSMKKGANVEKTNIYICVCVHPMTNNGKA